MFSAKISSDKNFTVGYCGAVSSNFDVFASFGMAATVVAWLAAFLLVLLSTGCTPAPGTSGVDTVPAVKASASKVVAAPTSTATADAPEATSGNVVDMTY